MLVLHALCHVNPLQGHLKTAFKVLKKKHKSVTPEAEEADEVGGAETRMERAFMKALNRGKAQVYATVTYLPKHAFCASFRSLM